MEDIMEKQKNWFLRNDNWVKVYLTIMIIITVIISILAVKEIVDYTSGVKTDAVVTDVVNKRIKSGARKQSSYKATDLKLRYDVDGTEYNEELHLQGWYRYRKMETTEISYDPKNPENVLLLAKIYKDLEGDALWGLFVGLQAGLFIHKKKRKERVEK
jgi:hypothetical protein